MLQRLPLSKGTKGFERSENSVFNRCRAFSTLSAPSVLQFSAKPELFVPYSLTDLLSGSPPFVAARGAWDADDHCRF